MYEWFNHICDDYYEEQVIKERKLLDEIEKIFYNDFHKSFFITIPNILVKFFIKKGFGHIIEAQPPLYTKESSKWCEDHFF